jgi:hypothetical protein
MSLETKKECSWSMSMGYMLSMENIFYTFRNFYKADPEKQEIRIDACHHPDMKGVFLDEIVINKDNFDYAYYTTVFSQPEIRIKLRNIKEFNFVFQKPTKEFISDLKLCFPAKKLYGFSKIDQQ